MTSGLGQHALTGVNEDNRHVCGRGARHHVAGILLMPWRVGDDEFTSIGIEEAIGDINRNALFALCSQTINQQRKVNIGALRADLF